MKERDSDASTRSEGGFGCIMSSAPYEASTHKIKIFTLCAHSVGSHAIMEALKARAP